MESSERGVLSLDDLLASQLGETSAATDSFAATAENCSRLVKFHCDLCEMIRRSGRTEKLFLRLVPLLAAHSGLDKRNFRDRSEREGERDAKLNQSILEYNENFGDCTYYQFHDRAVVSTDYKLAKIPMQVSFRAVDVEKEKKKYWCFCCRYEKKYKQAIFKS